VRPAKKSYASCNRTHSTRRRFEAIRDQLSALLADVGRQIEDLERDECLESRAPALDAPETTASPSTPNQALADTDLLNQDEAAAVLGLKNPRTLAAWRIRRMGPPYRKLASRLVRYERGDLLRWAEHRAR
jgi:hypothetical protein